MIFDAKVLRHFSKIPIAYNGEDEGTDKDDDMDGNNSKRLISPEEEIIYQPLYDKLVNHEKIKLIVSGKITSPNSTTEKQVTNHIIRINSEVSGHFLKFYPWVLRRFLGLINTSSYLPYQQHTT
jgi:hypothetical protein